MAGMSSESRSCQGKCECDREGEREGTSLPRRQLMGAAMLTGLLPWSAAMAGSCDGQALQAAKSVVAARDVCWECLQRRAQQRSPFVNREAA